MPFSSSQVHPPGQSQIQQMIQQMTPNVGPLCQNGFQTGHRVPTSGPPVAPQDPPKPMMQIKVEVVNSVTRASGGSRVAQVVTNQQSPQPVEVATPQRVSTPQGGQRNVNWQQVSPSSHHSPPPAQPPHPQRVSTPQSGQRNVNWQQVNPSNHQSPPPAQPPQQNCNGLQPAVVQQPQQQAQVVQQQPQVVQQQPQVVQQQPNDCGCRWFACPFCNGGKIPEMDVSVVSLGSWCGVSQCMRGLKIRTAAFPFDWNRVSMDGTIHFLENKFEDFLQWQSTKDFPWDPDHGGKTYCGEHHSFWHDDLSKPEEVEKYKRRIDRFLKNPVKKLLFIRAANELAEVSKAEKLLETLKETFPDNEIWLLIIIDHQAAAESFMLEGTEGRLMIHLTDKRHIRTWMYYDDVKAYDEAVLMALGTVDNRPISANYRPPRPIDSISKLMASLEPFYCGNPQSETWDPKPLAPQANPVVTTPLPSHRDRSPLVERTPTTSTRMTMTLSPCPAVRRGYTQQCQGYPRFRAPGQSPNLQQSIGQRTTQSPNNRAIPQSPRIGSCVAQSPLTSPRGMRSYGLPYAGYTGHMIRHALEFGVDTLNQSMRNSPKSPTATPRGSLYSNTIRPQPGFGGSLNIPSAGGSLNVPGAGNAGWRTPQQLDGVSER